MLGNLRTIGNELMIGAVSSVDVENRTAKVIFADRADVVSGDLKILQNAPTIAAERRTGNPGGEETRGYAAKYHCADRKLGLGETYVKGTRTAEREYAGGAYGVFQTAEPDVIEAGSGSESPEESRLTVKVYPWLPYIGQLVLCAFLKNGGGDGFVLGGF
jgi:hypothetical protein